MDSKFCTEEVDQNLTDQKMQEPLLLDGNKGGQGMKRTTQHLLRSKKEFLEVPFCPFHQEEGNLLRSNQASQKVQRRTKTTRNRNTPENAEK